MTQTRELAPIDELSFISVFDRSEKDYIQVHDTHTLVEIKGPRPGQEDRLVVANLRGFNRLAIEDQERALKTAFVDMQMKHGHIPEQGTTACVATAWIANGRIHATTAHLGDAEAYIVIVDETEKPFVTRLNKNLHDPQNEAKRLIATNRMVSRGRVNGLLAVSRAIGDPEILNHPSDHMADIDRLKHVDDSHGIPFQFGKQKAFLIVACDGLFEQFKSGDNKQEKESFVLSHVVTHKTSRNIARELTRTAYKKSRDNISVAVLHIQDATPISAAVFDGHGGEVVAAGMEADFYPTLRKYIANVPVLTDDQLMRRMQQVIDEDTNANESAKSDLRTFILEQPARPPVQLLLQPQPKPPQQQKAAETVSASFSYKNGAVMFPFSFNSKLPTFSNDKATLLCDIEKYLQGPTISQEDILNLFLEMKKRDGKYAVIHQQRHAYLDKFRLFFKRNVNADESYFWHTAEYQKAVKMLKDAYLINPLKAGYRRYADEQSLIDYVRGNAPVHFSKTSTRAKFIG